MSQQQSVRQFCTEIGKDPLLVQGAGGNVSWKEDDTLWVKASGTWLADANDENIFVPVNLEHLKDALKKQEYTVIPKTIEDTSLKPSIETLLHALMPHRIVVHLHAIEVLAHLVRKNFDLIHYPSFNKSLNARTVEYCKPGAELAEAIANQLNGTDNTQVIFLKNHGVIIGGENINEVSGILDYLSDFFYSPEIALSLRTFEAKNTLINGVDFYPVNEKKLHELVLNPKLIKHLTLNWVLYPDHVVFLGPYPFIYDSIEHAQHELSKSENLPDILFIKNSGVFSKKTLSKAKTAQLVCYYNIITRQINDGALAPLTNKQITELIDWDAEKYRMRFAK